MLDDAGGAVVRGARKAKAVKEQRQTRPRIRVVLKGAQDAAVVVVEELLIFVIIPLHFLITRRSFSKPKSGGTPFLDLFHLLVRLQSDIGLELDLSFLGSELCPNVDGIIAH